MTKVLRAGAAGGSERYEYEPALGGHTWTPLHAVGMTDDGIAALRRNGVTA